MVRVRISRKKNEDEDAKTGKYGGTRHEETTEIR